MKALTLARQNSESRVNAMETVFEGEAPVSGDNGVEIGQQIVEEIQVDKMSVVGKAG